MTHVSTPIFQGLFKNIVFRSVALVMGYFRFFLHTPDFKLLFIKSKKKFTVIVSKIRVLGHKITRGGGAPNTPPKKKIYYQCYLDIIIRYIVNNFAMRQKVMYICNISFRSVKIYSDHTERAEEKNMKSLRA